MSNCLSPFSTALSPDHLQRFLESEIESSLKARFEKMVALHSSRLAVKSSCCALTYRELNRRANVIAHVIRNQYGISGEPVALLFEPGADDIAAIIGILKGGNCYVPLDPAYPPMRITCILEDAGALLLLTNNKNLQAARCLLRPGQSILNIDGIIESRDVCESYYENPDSDIQPGDPAYIVYTSGSSGEPKGVVQTQRNVLFDIRRQGIDLQTTTEDRYGLLFASSSSASVCHIFGALLNGAAVLPFDVREEGLNRLTRWLATEEITILDINVAMFRQWCATFESSEKRSAAASAHFPKLRLLAPGSEPVYKRDVELYRRYFSPNCIMQNALGTTETRTVTQYFLTQATPVEESLVPVGQAIGGKEVLLLDELRQEVAPGEIGEIAVRSRYLSPGYWRRPELTSAAFLTDTEDDELRIYLTGDLGRMNEDGQLVHLGRKDFQVKIRGYRVEIAEVEMALFRVTGLPAAAAAFEDASGNQQLAAYLVVDRQSIPSIRDLRSALLEQLPDYAVPTRFEFLNALPTTLNGKLDRKALPAPKNIPAAGRATFEKPAGRYEAKLAQLYEEVLAVESVGATDDFFALGGHSLLATQLALRIEEEFGQVLPISSVVKAPTVRELGVLIQQNGDGRRRTTLVQVQAGTPCAASKLHPDRGAVGMPPLFCLPSVGGNALQFHRFASYLEPSQSVFGFDPLGLEGRARPHRTIGEMSAHYLSEIKSVQPAGPYLLCGFSMGGLVAFDMAVRLRASGEEVALLALFDTDFPGTHDELITPGWRAKVALRSRFRRRRCQWVYQWYRLRGLTAPRSIRNEYVQSQHLAAALRYHPTEYSGRITYFRAKDRQDRRPQPLCDGGWGRVRGAEIEAHDIRGNHALIREPYVGELARLMRLCLQRAVQK